jgi:hypothetical protein
VSERSERGPSPRDDLLVRRLRAALDARADLTTTTPDTWARIEDRARGRRPRRIATSAAAAVAVSALVVAGVALAGRDDVADDAITAADLGPGGLLRLVPSSVPEGYALASVRDEAVAAPAPEGDPSLVVGPVPADGELPGAFVHVVAFRDPGADATAVAPSDAVALDPATGEPVTGPSPDAVVYGVPTTGVDPVTGDIQVTVQLGDVAVAVLGRGVGEAELWRVVDGLVPVDPPVDGRALVAATDLPEGWVRLYEGSFAELYAQGASATVEYVRSGAGTPVDSLTISVSRTVAEPDLSLQPYVDAEGFALWTDVRGRTAVAVVVTVPPTGADVVTRADAAPVASTTLRWVEEPGTLVQVSGPVDLETAVAVADGLVVVDESGWRDLYAATEARTGAAAGGGQAPVPTSAWSIAPAG